MAERRLEQMHEQERFNAAEFQDRLVKNLSGELVKSTGRVFEAALKTEVQRTILPALEMITKTEVRQVLDAQIVRGIGESMNQVRICPYLARQLSNRRFRLFRMRLSVCCSGLMFRTMLPGPSPRRLRRSSNAM
jgi:hypothetical protein